MPFARLPIAILFISALTAQSKLPPDAQPFPAYKIVGNIYYVGASDITSFLITTPAGHILLNNGYEGSVPLIQASVEALGFKMRDIKIMLNGQAHFDHVAGHAALQKLTGAKIFASEADAAVIEGGGKGDPRWEGEYSYPPVKVDRRLRDGDTVSLGGTTLVAHMTPGHSIGCTTFTMRVNDDRQEYDVVFVGGTTINPGVKLLNNPKYPNWAADYAKTFQVLRSLKCDVFLGPHGSHYGMKEKYARLTKGEKPNPFIDPSGYASFVDQSERVYKDQLARERSSTSGRHKSASPAVSLRTSNDRNSSSPPAP
jgi:metallo-beta-lactamase class B